MRRSFIVFGAILLVQLLAVAGLAQGDRLPGRWEGTAQMPQGEQPATATFKKEGDAYTGTITGLRGEMPFKEVKVDGDKVTAKAEIESPQGSFVINYKFAIEGETLKGEGQVDFGGQTYNFAYNLKRAGEAPAAGAASPPQPQPQATPRAAPVPVPQPQQKQSLDYFVGQWNFKWVGRESPLGPGGPREGITTFKLAPGGKTLESRTDGKSEAGSYQESAVIGFDEGIKVLSFSERRGRMQITSKGDWSSPISIRFTVDPIKVKGQTLQLRRTILVISPYSFRVTEELSEDGGPFLRLGQGIFSKASTSAAKN